MQALNGKFFAQECVALLQETLFKFSFSYFSFVFVKMLVLIKYFELKLLFCYQKIVWCIEISVKIIYFNLAA